LKASHKAGARHLRDLTSYNPLGSPAVLGELARPRGVWALVLRPASKRTMDVVLSATALLVFLPVLFALSAAVAADGGPALFSHQRVGRGGRPFRCLKFRSMRLDADRQLAALLASDPAAHLEWQAARKLRRDPRVTAVGRVLRATSLDELPQLVNVLRGEMSFVGPRPERPEFVELFGANLRHHDQPRRVRPGVTGWSQLQGLTGRAPLAERVRWDDWYVENWSLRLDLKIALMTVRDVCRGNAASAD